MFDIPEANLEVAQKQFWFIFIIREISVLQAGRVTTGHWANSRLAPELSRPWMDYLGYICILSIKCFLRC